MVDGNIILSVAKAMELLQLLSRSKKPLSLKELSAQCGYPKSTVFGLLTTMRTYDVVTQTPDGKYSLGLPMTQFTPHTVTDPSALMREVETCRANGYAIENGEYKIGLRSVSAPVYTVEGKAAYAVGVIGMFRSPHSEEFRAAVEQVCVTASMISTALGYRKQEETL